jgi:hypothetical protein
MISELENPPHITPAGVHAGFENLDRASTTLTHFSFTPHPWHDLLGSNVTRPYSRYMQSLR